MTHPTERGWATASQIAKVCGLTRQTIHSHYVPRLAPEHVTRTKPKLLYGPAVIELLPIRTEQVKAAASDPLLAGGSDSPGLERYRAAKAEHAELDLAERRGQLLSVECGREWIMAIMRRIRQFGDELRSHPELQSEFSDMLNDCKRLVETLKAPEEPDLP